MGPLLCPVFFEVTLFQNRSLLFLSVPLVFLSYFLISMFLGFLWCFYGMSKKFLWEFYGIGMVFQKDVYGISTGFLWDFYGMSMIFLWDFYF